MGGPRQVHCPAVVALVVGGRTCALQRVHPFGQVVVVLTIPIPFEVRVVRLVRLAFRQRLADPQAATRRTSIVDPMRAKDLMRLLDQALRKIEEPPLARVLEQAHPGQHRERVGPKIASGLPGAGKTARQGKAFSRSQRARDLLRCEDREEPAMADLSEARRQMVAHQIQERGVRSAAVARAMREVPREEFMSEELREFAYADSPLPIGEGQTISQPYIVAYMTETLELEGGERVLEVGTGSGYAAAVLARIADQVYTIERHPALARTARSTLRRLGYDNVHVIEGDGRRGWPEAAPYDAIVVAAGGIEVPPALRSQLAVGGRLVIPVGPTPREQRLVRVTRISEDVFDEDDLLPVRFVPLIGEQGWQEAPGRVGEPARKRVREVPPRLRLPERIAAAAERFDSIDEAEMDGLLDRIGSARLVLVGEATHGTSEFYRMRTRISQALIQRKGFCMIAVEADWPDAGRIDHYVRHREAPPAMWKAFTRFPEWMWRNQEVEQLVEWLRRHNSNRPYDERVAFHGLDLYSLYTSINVVLHYLDDVDAEAARVARSRYGCLTPWESDPATYGAMALSGRYRECERDVTAMLSDMLRSRAEYSASDGERFADAVHNARVVANAERYYRIMYYGAAESWNLRDTHMFETLNDLLGARGPQAKAVVWAHNSHLGDARHTEMSARGEHNLGQLCREHYASEMYSVGFGTDRGTVAAADDWDGPMKIKDVRASHLDSYERQCHEAGVPSFLLPLGKDQELKKQLLVPRLDDQRFAVAGLYRVLYALRLDHCQCERLQAVEADKRVVVLQRFRKGRADVAGRAGMRARGLSKVYFLCSGRGQ
ncbi:MAG TPA: protein-L-isoaspartate(D-aspartate) O-methyltransferase [Burkholderiales bacterium]